MDERYLVECVPKFVVVLVMSKVHAFALARAETSPKEIKSVSEVDTRHSLGPKRLFHEQFDISAPARATRATTKCTLDMTTNLGTHSTRFLSFNVSLSAL